MSVGNVQTGAAWCVDWDMSVLKSSGSCKSSQPACSQFCDELAASAVDAVTAVHAIASQPQDDPGYIVLHTLYMSRYCPSELHVAENCSSQAWTVSDYTQVWLQDPSTVGGACVRLEEYWKLYSVCAVSKCTEHFLKEDARRQIVSQNFWSDRQILTVKMPYIIEYE